MLVTISIIIGTSVGLATGLIGGGALGFAIGNRKITEKTERKNDEDYTNLINYYKNN